MTGPEDTGKGSFGEPEEIRIMIRLLHPDNK